MRVLHASGAALVLATLAYGAPAVAEVEASLDLRLVESDGRNSFLDGGLGKLRFDAGDEGLQLGRARLAWRGGIGGDWHAVVDLSAWNVHDRNVVDLTEALVEWRPVPRSAWRSNVKLGAFYPPVSLEHRGPGWSNPYTLSSSALNTWVGEELRTIGVAYELEYLGTLEGKPLDAGVTAAVFGWNDPAGVELAFRGFSLNDRQTPLFGRIGTYAFGGREQRVMFSEIDDRPGYHVGAYVKSDSGLELRGLHYDNRGDSGDYKQSIEDFAWDTRFDTAGLRYDHPAGATLIAQWLGGSTSADDSPVNRWKYDTKFVLLAYTFGKHRLAARRDEFQVHQDRGANTAWFSREHGSAWTLGWTWSLREHVEIMAEWLRIDSTRSSRAALGEAPHAVERSAQLAVRLFL